IPEVVCYKGSAISYEIAKRLVRIKYICLVNLIMDREVVKELIQKNLTVSNLNFQLQEILSNSQKIAQVKNDYFELRELLSKGGRASANAAKSIHAFLTGASVS